MDEFREPIEITIGEHEGTWWVDCEVLKLEISAPTRELAIAWLAEVLAGEPEEMSGAL